MHFSLGPIRVTFETTIVRDNCARCGVPQENKPIEGVGKDSLEVYLLCETCTEAFDRWLLQRSEQDDIPR